MARILLFGRIADSAGWRQREIALPEGVDTVGALRAHLALLLPEISETTTRVAVNRLMVSDDTAVENIDEVAFMPPLSGG